MKDKGDIVGRMFQAHLDIVFGGRCFMIAVNDEQAPWPMALRGDLTNTIRARQRVERNRVAKARCRDHIFDTGTVERINQHRIDHVEPATAQPQMTG